MSDFSRSLFGTSGQSGGNSRFFIRYPKLTTELFTSAAIFRQFFFSVFRNHSLPLPLFSSKRVDRGFLQNMHIAVVIMFCTTHAHCSSHTTSDKPKLMGMILIVNTIHQDLATCGLATCGLATGGLATGGLPTGDFRYRRSNLWTFFPKK